MSIPKLFDVHTHVQFASFNEDREVVIQRSLDAGVWLINVGTQKDASAKAVEIAHKYPKGVWASIGLHPIHTESSYHDEKELGIIPSTQPWTENNELTGFTQLDSKSFVLQNGDEMSALSKPERGQDIKDVGLTGFTSKEEDFDYGYYLQLAQDPRVVAIGECGFDFYRLNPQTKRKQKKVFMRHIELAYVVKKPLMIHCRSGVPERAPPLAGRSGVSEQIPPQNVTGNTESPLSLRKTGHNAFEYLLRVLESQKGILNSPPGVIHFFSGSKGDAQKLMDLGFSFSFGGVVTFTSDYDEVIKYIPMERILLETDAPYVAPIPYRGKRNKPEYIAETAKRIAEIKGLDPETVLAATVQNALKIFKVS